MPLAGPTFPAQDAIKWDEPRYALARAPCPTLKPHAAHACPELLKPNTGIYYFFLNLYFSNCHENISAVPALASLRLP